MEHVLFLEDKQLRKDLLDCSECRLDIRPGLSAIAIFEFLVSKLFMVDPSLTSGPVLAHLMRICVGYVSQASTVGMQYVVSSANSMSRGFMPSRSGDR